VIDTDPEDTEPVFGPPEPNFQDEYSYFLMADIAHLGLPDDVSFCRFLTTEIGVAAIPPSAFYADPARAPLLARFCFAKRDETLQAAAERLGQLQSQQSAVSGQQYDRP